MCVCVSVTAPKMYMLITFLCKVNFLLSMMYKHS